jgi:pimeloyl-ACP methyl ester carboxylesterase
MGEASGEQGFFPEGGSGSALWRAAVRQLSVDGLKRTPPIWREGRMFEELAALRRNPIASGVGLPEGDGLPVFLIPGYMAGDASLAPMARALRAAKYRPETSGVRLNVGCAAEMLGPIEARLAAHVATNGGRKAFVIGQSRGGGFGRWLAARRPDLVGGLVTLGTPLCDPLALNLLVLANLGVVSALGTLGVRGILSTRCLRLDRCCGPAWRELTGPLAEGMPFLSIYSRSDGIVDWRACLDPAARHLEVDSSHCGMAFNVDVFSAIGAELRSTVEVVGSAAW